MPTFIRTLLLAAAFALGTWILGWWAVPLIGAAWGLMRRRRARFLDAFAAAAIAWVALLAFDAARGPLGRLTTVMGGIFLMPGVLVLVVSVLFAALLAGCAAQVAGTARVARLDSRA